jgi:hypothetical protein
MFSLIISIIAIALVAALALASIYYGGDAFQEGTVKAEASTIVNQGQQVQGAVTMAEVNGDVVGTDITVLTTKNYLKEVPKFGANSWTVTATEAVLVLGTDAGATELCAAVEGVFDGDDTTAGALNAQAFGCYDNSGTKTAYFKL